jgi:hypothetical protein
MPSLTMGGTRRAVSEFLNDKESLTQVIRGAGVDLGFSLSYQASVGHSAHGTSAPTAKPALGSRGRATIEIAHPAWNEFQWDLDVTATRAVGRRGTRQ